MRKTQKDSIIELANLLQKAQEHVKNLLLQQEYASVLDLLQQCQQGAIQIGTIIEQTEGEGFPTVKLLEEYCELVFQVFESVQKGFSTDDNINEMDKLLSEIEKGIKADIQIRKEVVFFPYKASMWDSLESIWKAADADPDCDAYVVPIPYYDKNKDGTVKEMHYEGDLFPEYVPITHYTEYPLEEVRPDAVFIHNPYDGANFITTVHPRFYSGELKKHTDCLVYVPYYITGGSLGEGQALCSAYLHVNYMTVQAEKYVGFIDPVIPREKILPLGSPKFDRVLELCQNPPKMPEAWEEKAHGKTVYFYNTSIKGMLGDTRSFLLKMEYVFKCFADRKDACLLWRPHPLLDATFESMRKQYRPIYDKLKEFFIQSNMGIYDDTPDMEKSIAFSDAYIGEIGSSVIPLFGLVGKPIFILDNHINSVPEADDWRGEIIKPFYEDGHDRWRVTHGNKLFYSPNDDYRYEYYCDLNEYAGGNYYLRVIEACGKVFVCPKNAFDILVVENRQVVKRIAIDKKGAREGAFVSSYRIGNYLFFIPNTYSSVVRYDMIRDKVDYIDGYHDFIVQIVAGGKRYAGCCVWKNYLMIASPSDHKVLAIDAESMKVQTLAVKIDDWSGSFRMAADKDEIWMLPFSGTRVVRWNPAKGTCREYECMQEGFVCKQLPSGYTCSDRPFWSVAVYGDSVVLSPFWGNMFVCIDKKSGCVRPWHLPVPVGESAKNGYYTSGQGPYLVRRLEGSRFLMYSETERKLYEVDIESGQCKEREIFFDEEELSRHVKGFSEISEWQQYMCFENAFNSLPQFLSGQLQGQLHDGERQKTAYAKVAANGDGTAGESIYRYIKTKM